MERKYFTFYRSYRDAVYTLPASDQLALVHAVLDYALDFTPPELSGACKGFWTLIKPTLDKGIRNYKNACKPQESDSGATTERNESDSGANEKQIIDNRIIEDRLNDNRLNEYGINEYLQSESGAKTDPPPTDPVPEPTLENITDYLKSINSTKSPDKVYTIMGETLKLAPDWRVIVKAWSEERR